MAIGELGSGLSAAEHHEDALSVKEAELSMMRRLGDSESNILTAQGNLANSYSVLGREEEALRIRRDVYSGTLKLYGEEHRESLVDAFNYATSLVQLKRYEEAKSLLRESISVARRVGRDDSEVSIRMRALYAQALYKDPRASLDGLREAVKTLEDTDRIARRVFGGAHPLVLQVERALRDARTLLRAREAPGS